MMSSHYLGKSFRIDPKLVKFDDSVVEFNRKQTTDEYLATKLSIEKTGQQHPIVMNSITRLYEDGRHRVKACIELGLDVLCIEIDGNIDLTQRLAIYNIDAMSGRELTVAQKAIQAHKFALISSTTLEECAQQFNVDVRQVNAANAIAGLNREDIFDSIMTTKEWIKPDGRPTKNLRAIASILKQKAETLIPVVNPTERFNYEDLINTEKGKTEFWAMRALVNVSAHERDIMLVELLNYKYALKVDKDTGEVTDA